jgi:hypothetical protein
MAEDVTSGRRSPPSKDRRFVDLTPTTKELLSWTAEDRY